VPELHLSAVDMEEKLSRFIKILYRKSNFSQTKQVKQAGAAGTTDITSLHEAYFQV